jgi:hypothetical protein
MMGHDAHRALSSRLLETVDLDPATQRQDSFSHKGRKSPSLATKQSLFGKVPGVVGDGLGGLLMRWSYRAKPRADGVEDHGMSAADYGVH